METTGTMRPLWLQHRLVVLRVAVAILTVFAVLKLGPELYRLLFEQGVAGAHDLRLRYDEVARWFAHLPVYPELPYATYPPASYLLFWPAVGWLPWAACRWLWAMASLLCLVWISRMMVRESGATSPEERWLVAVLPFAINATGIALGNGQLVVLLAPMLLLAVLLITRKPAPGMRSGIVAAALMLVSLVHPATASPFMWIILFCSPSLRPGLLVVIAYLAVTAASAWFQPESLPVLIGDWLANGQSSAVDAGYADLNKLMVLLGLRELAMPASGLALAGLGLWVYLHRRADPWILLGVTATVARLWTYHGMYDDFLIVLPLVALFRIAKGRTGSSDALAAGLLLAATTVTMLMPAQMLAFWGPPWPAVFLWLHVLVWMANLVFLQRVGKSQAKTGGK